jgi:multimeric flavodoxin WrbA
LKAVAICGSRHAGGNTEHLLKHALARLKRLGIEGALVPMLWKKVFPCRGCGACATRKNGTCVIEGDDFAALFKSMREADVLLIGGPVDPGAAPPDLKTLLERACCVSRASGNLFSRKIGAPVAVVSKEPSRHSLQRLLTWFPVQNMIVPGALGYPLVKGRDGIASGVAIQADAGGEAVMESLAENLAWLAGKTATSSP